MILSTFISILLFPLADPPLLSLLNIILLMAKDFFVLSFGRILLQSRIILLCLSLVSSYLNVWVKKKTLTTSLNVLCKSYHTFTTGNSEFINTIPGL